MDKLINAIKDWLRQSTFLKILFIGFVMLLLQIPISMISGQIFERQSTKQTAIFDITEKWGRKQIIIGPKLVVPYYKITEWTDSSSKELKTTKTKQYATFLAETLAIDAVVNNENRSRGIFNVPLYKTDISLSGNFNTPNFHKLGIDPSLIIWDETELVINVSDPRAIQKQIFLNWNKNKIAFEPGTGASNTDGNGFHVPIGDVSQIPQFKFHTVLNLNGSNGLYAAPMAKETAITIKSDWPDPSFQGQWLPTNRTVSDAGFTASWFITSISRNFSQQWENTQFNNIKIQQSIIGVNFIDPVDNYRMTERSIKYVSLFLLMTFVLIWLFEILSKIRVHMIQYLLIGTGMCMFYLLLLALSEHIGFIGAYIIASIVIIAIVGLYSLSVLKSRKRAAILSTSTTTLYIYLFTLLQEESYSLLFGSFGLLALLTAIMFITRNIDWFSVGKIVNSENT